MSNSVRKADRPMKKAHSQTVSCFDSISILTLRQDFHISRQVLLVRIDADGVGVPESRKERVHLD